MKYPYIPRLMEPLVLEVSKEYPVVLLVGPRQTGKTRMLRHLAEGTDRGYVSLDDLTNRALANGRRGQPEGREVCAEKGWVPAERGAAGVEQGPRGPPLAPSDWSAAQLTGSRPCGVGWGKRRGARGVAMGNGPGGARDWASRPAGGSLARVYRSFATKSQFLILAFKARWSAWPASRALGLGPATPLLSRLRVDPRAAGVSDSPSQPSLSLLLLLLSRFSRVRLSATP